MSDEERIVFASTLAEVCDDMFRGAVPCPAAPELTSAEPDTLVTSIGLAGQDFRGALAALALPKFFLRTYPPELKKTSLDNGALVDWAGEIANQLLGRIKNRLGRLGLNFNISTPTVVRGDRLTLGGPGSAVRHALMVGGERIDIVFDIAHDEGKPLLPATGPVVVASLEGEGLLF